MPRLINRLVLVSLFFVDPLVAGENLEYRSLAEYYAPVVYQETRSATLDFITRFDFDGDWNGANNWDNAYLFELPAYVYYAMIESSGHYFITYAFFHPRDYTARPMEGFVPKTEHENDMEGCTLVIEKDETAWGRPILLETLAHDHFYKYDNPHYPQVEEGSASLDGSIVFLKQEDATRHRQPAIYIEPEGHGVKAATEQVLDSSFQHPGVIYRFAGRGAEVPPSNTATDVSYDLISIEETLWAKRSEVGKNSLYCCSDLYSLPDGQMTPLGSSFNGPIGSCAANGGGIKPMMAPSRRVTGFVILFLPTASNLQLAVLLKPTSTILISKWRLALDALRAPFAQRAARARQSKKPLLPPSWVSAKSCWRVVFHPRKLETEPNNSFSQIRSCWNGPRGEISNDGAGTKL